MDINTRNKTLCEFENLIWWVINKNRPLICALRLDVEDVFQDLSIVAMKAIEGFDSTRSDSMFTHVRVKLQYEILNQKHNYKPCGVTGRNSKCVRITSLDGFYEDGQSLEIPYEADYSEAEINTLFSLLEPAELYALRMKINGEQIRRKQHLIDLEAARHKLSEAYEGSVALCC